MSVLTPENLTELLDTICEYWQADWPLVQTPATNLVTYKELEDWNREIAEGGVLVEVVIHDGR